MFEYVGGKSSNLFPTFTHSVSDVVAVLRKLSQSQKALALLQFLFEQHDCRSETRHLLPFAIWSPSPQHPVTYHTVHEEASRLPDHVATMSKYRRGLYFNDEWTSWSSHQNPSTEQVHKFHRSLPGYEQTPLRKLEELAQDIGVRAIYLKDEGDRLGLPSFKILGASWGTFRAIASRVNLPLDLDLHALKQALKGSGTSLHAATDGNHGRAVARMGYWLDLAVEIHVPAVMDTSTVRLIKSEGALVTRSMGTYDDAVLEAHDASRREGGLLIQDFAFGDYEDIPQVSTRIQSTDSTLKS
jgi:hypothetical protein